MKELSIEEKAKAYDEAIKVAADIKAGTATYITDGTPVIDAIFPELAESKDEKIRKKIIKLVKEHSVNHERCQMEAWLEKQVEQKHQYNSRPRYVGEGELLGKKDTDDLYLKGICDTKHELEKQGKQKYVDKIQPGKKYKCIASPRYSTFVKGFIYKPDDKFLCSLMNFCCDCFEPIEDGEQKPILDVEIPFGAKDSALEEVTYDIPKGYHAEIEDNKVVIKQGEQKPVNTDYISGIRKELLSIEDNAKNINGLTESQWVAIRAAHRLLGEYITKEQKPWSEEDENIIVKIKTKIAQCNGFNKKNREEMFSLIDSLRPQSSWRPSDEQMKALSIVMCGVDDPLFSLYQDLKKLRGE